MSDPRGWKKNEDMIEAAKAEILAAMPADSSAAVEAAKQKLLELLGDKVTLDAVYTLLTQGVMANCVKSVQHQYVSNKEESKTFTIASVDPNKSAVFPAGNAYGGDGSQFVVKSFDGTTVEIVAHTNNNSYSSCASIFVIEFR